MSYHPFPQLYMAHGRGVGPLDSNGTSYEDPVHAPAEQAGHPDHRQGRGPEEVGGLMVEHDRAGAGRGQEQAGGDDGVQEAVLVQDLPLPAAMRGPHQRLRPPREQWIVRDNPADDGLAEPEQPAVAVEPEPTRVLSRRGRTLKPPDRFGSVLHGWSRSLFALA